MTKSKHVDVAKNDENNTFQVSVALDDTVMTNTAVHVFQLHRSAIYNVYHNRHTLNMDVFLLLKRLMESKSTGCVKLICLYLSPLQPTITIACFYSVVSISIEKISIEKSKHLQVMHMRFELPSKSLI